MPKYTVTSPDGRRYTVEAPEGATEAQVLARVQAHAKATPAPTKKRLGGGWGGQFLEGVIPGASNALGGLMRMADDGVKAALSDKVDWHPMQSYNQGHRDAREGNRAYAERNPGISGTAQVAGIGAGLALPAAKLAKAPTMGQKVTAGGKTGGAYGFLSGLLSSEGEDLLDKASDGVSTALTGMGVGAAMPWGLRGAGLVTRPATARMAPLVQGTGRALDKVGGILPGQLGRRIQAEGQQLARDPAKAAANVQLNEDLRGAQNPATGRPFTPTEVAQEVKRRQGLGVPAAPADVHESARRSYGAAARTPGPATAAVRRAIDRRQEQMSARMVGHIQETLGPTANVDRQADALRDLAKTNARPLYDISDDQSVPYVQELQELMGRPSARDALQVAGRELQDDPSLGNLLEMGLVQDADGAFRIDKAPSMPLYDHVKTVLDKTVYAGNSPLATPEITRASNGAMAIRRRLLEIMDGDGSGPRIHQPGSEVAPQAPGGPLAPGGPQMPRGLPQLPTGLTGLPEGLPTPPPGGLKALPSPSSFPKDPQPGDPFPVPYQETPQPNYGRRLTPEEAPQGPREGPTWTIPQEGLNPYWKPARAAYAGPTQARQALELGEEMAKDGGEDIANRMEDLTGSQVDFFRLGHRSGLAQDVRKPGDWANAAARLAGSFGKREGLTAAHGSKADDFLQRTLAEHEGHQTWKAVRGNSQTADRAAEMAEQDQQIEQLAQGALQTLAGNPGVGLSTALGAILKGQTRAGEVKGHMAQVLAETDRTKLDSAVHDLLRERARKAIVEKNKGEVGQRTARLFGSWLGTNLTEPIH